MDKKQKDKKYLEEELSQLNINIANVNNNIANLNYQINNFEYPAARVETRTETEINWIYTPVIKCHYCGWIQ